jgi:hypothetical protein
MAEHQQRIVYSLRAAQLWPVKFAPQELTQTYRCWVFSRTQRSPFWCLQRYRLHWTNTIRANEFQTVK